MHSETSVQTTHPNAPTGSGDSRSMFWFRVPDSVATDDPDVPFNVIANGAILPLTISQAEALRESLSAALGTSTWSRAARAADQSIRDQILQEARVAHSQCSATPQDLEQVRQASTPTDLTLSGDVDPQDGCEPFDAASRNDYADGDRLVVLDGPSVESGDIRFLEPRDPYGLGEQHDHQFFIYNIADLADSTVSAIQDLRDRSGLLATMSFHGWILATTTSFTDSNGDLTFVDTFRRPQVGEV